MAKCAAPLSLVHGHVKFYINDMELAREVLATLPFRSSSVSSGAEVSETAIQVQNMIAARLQIHCPSLRDAIFQAKHVIHPSTKKVLNNLNAAHSAHKHTTSISRADLLHKVERELEAFRADKPELSGATLGRSPPAGDGRKRGDKKTNGTSEITDNVVQEGDVNEGHEENAKRQEEAEAKGEKKDVKAGGMKDNCTSEEVTKSGGKEQSGKKERRACAKDVADACSQSDCSGPVVALAMLEPMFGDAVSKAVLEIQASWQGRLDRMQQQMQLYQQRELEYEERRKVVRFAEDA